MANTKPNTTNASSNHQNNAPNSNVNEFNKFLTNNVEFLQDKFLLHFGNEFPMTELLTKDKLERSLKFIYDVFSFGRYQKDPKLNQTLRKSLTQNVSTFHKQSIKTVPIFNSTISISMLKYCIENNDMFAVHYDKKTKKQEQQKDKEVNEIEQNRSGVELKEEYQQAQKKEDTKQQIPSQVKDQQNMTKSQIHQEKQPLQNNEVPQNENEFILGNAQPTPPLPNPNPKKHLKLLFDFYCKQQQNVGRSPTFDKISHICQTMTLGKFIAFANACDLIQNRHNTYNQGKIDKKTLMHCWKKIAKEKKEIGFQIFNEVIEEVKRVDDKLAERLGLNEPTSISKLKENLKYLILPFNTRDSQGRQLVSLNHRPFIPRLTGHSGMVEASLREEMIIRKQAKRNGGNPQDQMRLRKGESLHFYSKTSQIAQKTDNSLKNQVKIENESIKPRKNVKNSQNSLNPTDFSFLSNLVASQEQDDIFLKDYQLPSRKPASTHRYHPLRAQHQTTTTIDNYEPRGLKQAYTGLIGSRQRGSRQQAIIPEMQKRIKEIERKENEKNKKRN